MKHVLINFLFYCFSLTGHGVHVKVRLVKEVGPGPANEALEDRGREVIEANSGHHAMEEPFGVAEARGRAHGAGGGHDGVVAAGSACVVRCRYIDRTKLLFVFERIERT